MVSDGKCTEINECIPVNPCGKGTCRKVPGSYSCDCLPGYQFTNGQCIGKSAKPSQSCKACFFPLKC